MAWPTEEQIEFRMRTICESGEDRIFQRFDELHGIHITDTQVIHWLRANGRREMADQYIEWGECIDPDVDPTPQGPELVTDPADAPSYADHPLNKPAAKPDQTDAAEAQHAQLEQPLRDVVEAILVQLNEDGAYVDYADQLNEVVIDGNVDIVELAKRVTKAVYLSVAADTHALSKTLLETMQAMANNRTGSHDDIIRYGAYSGEAQTIALGLEKRVEELG